MPPSKIRLTRKDLSGNSETTIFHGLRAGNSPIYYQFTTRSLDTIHPLMPTGIRATAIPQDCCGAYPPLPPPYARLWPRTPAPPVAGHPVTGQKVGEPSEQQKRTADELNFISRLVILFFHQIIHGDIQCFGNLVERNQRNMVSVFCALNLPQIIMPKACYLCQLGRCHIALYSIFFDILSYTLVEELTVEVGIFHQITIQSI